MFDNVIQEKYSELNKASKKDVLDYIDNWDGRFPVDYWWRQRHKVAFNSVEHRNSCFIDQLIEYEEEVLVKEYFEKDKKEYTPGRGDYIRKRKMTEAEIKKAFDELDLDKL